MLLKGGPMIILDRIAELTDLLYMLFILFNPIPFICIMISVRRNHKKNENHQKSSYYQITRKSLDEIKHDAGTHGEYLIYQNLKLYEETGAKFLFNLYVPKEDGTTTEIDMLMISRKGIFVFESKNYQGWIFGNEEQRYWYQTISKGRFGSHKEKFYNPILQNQIHINCLKNLLGGDFLMHSIIVFADRCQLMDIKMHSKNIGVTHTYNVASVIWAFYDCIKYDVLTQIDIDKIYSFLYPYTQFDDNIKALHNYNINIKKYSDNPDTAPIIKVFNTPSQNDSPKCPWCNSNLVVRTVKKGDNLGKKFYGCSNFPKCRYKKNF